MILLFVSCDQAAGPASQRSDSSGDKGDSIDIHITPSGVDAYKAIFQGRGALAEDIPLVHNNYQISYFISAESEEDSLYNAFSDNVIDAISTLDPGFFADFEAHITSGDPLAVSAGLQSAAEITVQAALTIPEFQDQLLAAAENQQLLESATAQIEQIDPESEIDEVQMGEILTQLGEGQEPTCVTVVYAVAAAIYVVAAYWAAVAMNVAVAINAAVVAAAFLWTATWIFNKKALPEDAIAFGSGELSSEMLVGFIVENWVADNPEM
jgi:hypothetical protein